MFGQGRVDLHIYRILLEANYNHKLAGGEEDGGSSRKIFNQFKLLGTP